MFPLTSEQESAQKAFREFTHSQITPHANHWDKAEAIPREVIQALASRGWLGAFLPREIGGLGGDLVTYGLLNEEIGRGCSSLRSLLTVQGMVCYALQRWGSKAQKETVLPRLASGEVIGAFALTEPDTGSDARNIQMSMTRTDSEWVLDGCKTWITFGQIADYFLVFGSFEAKPVAILVPRDSPGLEIEPLGGILGTSASMLATLNFRQCRVAREMLVGGPGFGITAVALSALSIGRFSVASGCVGILQACLEDSMTYAAQRKQFGTALSQHQLIREMLTDMIVDTKAARLLVRSAGIALSQAPQDAMREILAAKYFASRACFRAADKAVQIHGANGCGANSSVARYLRDAKIMEIIEGSTQMQQIMIPKSEYEVLDLGLRAEP